MKKKKIWEYIILGISILFVGGTISATVNEYLIDGPKNYSGNMRIYGYEDKEVEVGYEIADNTKYIDAIIESIKKDKMFFYTEDPETKISIERAEKSFAKDISAYNLGQIEYIELRKPKKLYIKSYYTSDNENNRIEFFVKNEKGEVVYTYIPTKNEETSQAVVEVEEGAYYIGIYSVCHQEEATSYEYQVKYTAY